MNAADFKTRVHLMIKITASSTSSGHKGTWEQSTTYSRVLKTTIRLMTRQLLWYSMRTWLNKKNGFLALPAVSNAAGCSPSSGPSPARRNKLFIMLIMEYVPWDIFRAGPERLSTSTKTEILLQYPCIRLQDNRRLVRGTGPHFVLQGSCKVFKSICWNEESGPSLRDVHCLCQVCQACLQLTWQTQLIQSAIFLLHHISPWQKHCTGQRRDRADVQLCGQHLQRQWTWGCNKQIVHILSW